MLLHKISVNIPDKSQHVTPPWLWSFTASYNLEMFVLVSVNLKVLSDSRLFDSLCICLMCPHQCNVEAPSLPPTLPPSLPPPTLHHPSLTRTI